MKSYDLLLKNGKVIDPKNNLNGSFDVAISKSKISKIAKSIDQNSSNSVIDASNMIVCPGLIDLHAHCYGYFGAIFPDEMCYEYLINTSVCVLIDFDIYFNFLI